MKRAVVLGGGIGGVEAAISLRKKKVSTWSLSASATICSSIRWRSGYPRVSARSTGRVSVSPTSPGRTAFGCRSMRSPRSAAADRSFTLEATGEAAGFRLSDHRARRAQDASQGQGARLLDLRGAAGKPASEGASGRSDRQGQRHDRRRLRRQSQGLEWRTGRPGLRVPVQRASPAHQTEDAQAFRCQLLRADAEPGHPHGRKGRRHDGSHAQDSCGIRSYTGKKIIEFVEGGGRLRRRTASWRPT